MNTNNFVMCIIGVMILSGCTSPTTQSDIVKEEVTLNNTNTTVEKNENTQIIPNKDTNTPLEQNNETVWLVNDTASTDMMKKDMDNVDTSTDMMKKDMDNVDTSSGMMKKDMNTVVYRPDPRSVIASIDDISTEKRNYVTNLKNKYALTTNKEYMVNNNLVGSKLSVTRFISNNGDLFDITDYKDKKVVLIILRGFAGGVCLACSAQTLALSNTVNKFKEKNAQIILVYPGRAESIPVFTEVLANLTDNFDLPFPVVLDVELQLVESLSINGSLARPTSIIANSDGEILYAYVGKSITDRPTVDFLLQEVNKLSEK